MQLLTRLGHMSSKLTGFDDPDVLGTVTPQVSQ